MKKASRFLTALLLVGALLLSMASVAAAEDVVITWAVPGYDSEIEFMTRVKDLVHEKLDGIELELLVIPQQEWPDYYQKIVAMAAAGDCPDMGRVAERLLPGMIGNELLYDITDYVATLDPDKFYVDAMKGNNYKNGRYFGLPSGIYTTVTFYNKDLFDAAGLPYPSSDWANPTSLEQCASDAIALTSGEASEKVFGLSYRSSFASPAYWADVSLASGGGYIYAEDGETPLMNTPSHVAALEWYKALVQKGAVTLPTDTAAMNTVQMFTSGRLAMTVEGTWSVKQITENATGFRYGIAANAGAKGVTNPFTDCFVTYAQTKHPDECWKVLELLYSAEGWDAAQGTLGVPLLKEAFNGYLETNVVPFVDDDYSAQCLADSLNYTAPMPYSEYWEEASAQCNALKDEWLLGNLTSEELANECQNIMVRMKAKYER